METAATFQYVNLENKWPRFQLDALVNEGGVLHLAQVPGNPEAVGPSLDRVEGLTGPAGIGIDREGNLYIADPAHHQIIRVDVCDGSSEPLPCLQGPGSEPGQLNGPRGLIVGPREALYIADSGNHRIVVVDLHTQQWRAVWGQPEPFAHPEPGTAPGRFDQPWELTADQRGDLYVVDYGNRRVQKFDANGRVLPEFWETIQATAPAAATWEPISITTIILAGSEQLLVIDQSTNRLFVFGADGVFDEAATARWTAIATMANQPVDAAYDSDVLYIGDAGSRRILVFDQAGAFIGFAKHHPQPIAGLAVDHRGRLLVHPGGGMSIQRLVPASAYVTCGTFLAGPFSATRPTVSWQRLSIMADPLPEISHVQFFTYTSSSMDGREGYRPDIPVSCAGLANDNSLTPAADTTPLDTWRAAPNDSFDFLVGNEDGRYLWLAGLVQSDGTNSPALHQMRLEYNEEGWIRFLPTVYQRDSVNQAFLGKALSLLESLLDDEEALIDNLPALFDPQATSNENAPNSWLDWLAGWLALEMHETWSETQRREALAEAFGQYGQRGTIESLQYLIALYTGATAHIEEPSRFASVWSLGDISVLGFNTMLAPAHAQGAVVGTTATLDQSHLIHEEDYGVPLFEDVAHRFCVQVYSAEVAGRDAEAHIHQVLDREKPAHTSYHLCLIKARMRVGFQARVGIDSIVGGPLPDLVLETSQQLGLNTMLPSDPRAKRSAMGQGARVGSRTMLI